MEKEHFLETLQTELTDYIDKLEKFDWPTYEDDFIKQSKTVTYMANAMQSIEDNGVTDKQMEYLAKSDTPLGDIACIWMELEDHFVDPYTAQDAIRDIVDKELFNEEFEDQDLYDTVNAPAETNIEVREGEGPEEHCPWQTIAMKIPAATQARTTTPPCPSRYILKTPATAKLAALRSHCLQQKKRSRHGLRLSLKKRG